MNEVSDSTIEDLIERSSLGTAEAKRRRHRVSMLTGQALARAAAEKAALRARSQRPRQG